MFIYIYISFLVNPFLERHPASCTLLLLLLPFSIRSPSSFIPLTHLLPIHIPFPYSRSQTPTFLTLSLLPLPHLNPDPFIPCQPFFLPSNLSKPHPSPTFRLLFLRLISLSLPLLLLLLLLCLNGSFSGRDGFLGRLDVRADIGDIRWTDRERRRRTTNHSLLRKRRWEFDGEDRGGRGRGGGKLD